MSHRSLLTLREPLALSLSPLLIVLGLGLLGGGAACSSKAEAPSPGSGGTEGAPASGQPGATRKPDPGASTVPTEPDEASSAPFVCDPQAKPGELYALSAESLTAPPRLVSLCEFRGKVAMIVNVASKCGNTPQYTPLQSVYAKYKAQGFAVLGFPCNQFGSQESGTSEEISAFCTEKYKITFPMFEKIEVNGANAHPLYTWLKAQPGGAGDIEWNFAKFVVGRDGTLVKRFKDTVQPNDPAVIAAIEGALAKPSP